MLNNVALDVVIGLVFVFLLYSLFATILVEIISTKLGLRARNLKEAVDRMLNDERIPTVKKSWVVDKLYRLWDSLKLTKNPKNPRITNFYNHPEIKYLGSTGIFKNPSSYKALSFSKTLLNLLNETGDKKLGGDDAKMEDPHKGDIAELEAKPVTKERIQAALVGIISEHKTATGNEKERIVLDEETAKYVLGLWYDSYGDLIKFKLQLEGWFDRTMEQCTEWYKRKIRIVLIVLGFLLAWLFNADTFTIIRKLSTDKTAREQMVRMATAYVENNQVPSSVAGAATPDSVVSKEVNLYKQKLDSLLLVKNQLEEDINKANSLLGMGSWLPDTISTDTAGIPNYPSYIERDIVPKVEKSGRGNYIEFGLGHKFSYFFRILSRHFWGFLVTAIAISLGAPFWFDLLNKLMRLRTSLKQPIDSTGMNKNSTIVSPLNREG